MTKWRDYVDNVVRKFVSIIQEREITGNAMPLREFNASIEYVTISNFIYYFVVFDLKTEFRSQTLYDLHVVGTAKFHSGFIAKIDASGILSTSYSSRVVDTFVNQFFFFVIQSPMLLIYTFNMFLSEQHLLSCDIRWSANSL